MDLIGASKEIKQFIENAEATRAKADKVLDNLVQITDDLKAVTGVLRKVIDEKVQP